MNLVIVISTDDAETIYNAMRLANLAVKKGDYVNVFMLGKAVLFQQISSDEFDVMGQINSFEGEFFVWGVCMKAHGIEPSATCPVGWMEDLYEAIKEADKVITF